MRMNKLLKRKIRHFKIRKKVRGTATIPRLSVFRSNKQISAQLIDDQDAKTLLSASDRDIKEKNKVKKAKETGINLAKMATKKNIQKVVFDRSGFKYHGRVKALAEGAREGGLEF